MVKGVSKQVIVVNSPDKKLFDQAIFILSEDAVKESGITDAALLKEAKRIINLPDKPAKLKAPLHMIGSLLAGAVFTGAIWLLTIIL